MNFIPLSDKAFPLRSRIINYAAIYRFLLRIKLDTINNDMLYPKLLFLKFNLVSFYFRSSIDLVKKLEELLKI